LFLRWDNYLTFIALKNITKWTVLNGENDNSIFDILRFWYSKNKRWTFLKCWISNSNNNVSISFPLKHCTLFYIRVIFGYCVSLLGKAIKNKLFGNKAEKPVFHLLAVNLLVYNLFCILICDLSWLNIWTNEGNGIKFQ
jgi:hypothetical protein